MPPSVLHPLLSHRLSASENTGEPPYILGIAPTTSRSHLVLTHPSPELSVLDAGTLQLVRTLVARDDIFNGKKGTAGGADVSAVCAPGAGEVGDGAGLWSAGKDGRLRQWDLRTGGAAGTSLAHIRQPLPLLSIAASPADNLVVAGTELVGSDAYLVYWDHRKLVSPLYTHSQTHSDDITSLTFLPPTSTLSLPRSDTVLDPGPLTVTEPEQNGSPPLPPRFLLSGSTDGTAALSHPGEADEDEAQWAAEGLEGGVGGSVARAGWWQRREGGVGLWARSDMNGYGSWRMARGEEGVEMIHPKSFEPALFRPLSIDHAGRISRDETDLYASPPASAFVNDDEDQVQTTPEDGSISVDYMIDVCSSLDALDLEPSVLVGSNSGDIVLMHHVAATGSTSDTQAGQYMPSAFLRTTLKGHKDVVRCMYHDVESNILYTGSEDGVVCTWRVPEAETQAEAHGILDSSDEDDHTRRRQDKKDKRRAGDVLDGRKKSKKRRERP